MCFALRWESFKQHLCFFDVLNYKMKKRKQVAEYEKNTDHDLRPSRKQGIPE